MADRIFRLVCDSCDHFISVEGRRERRGIGDVVPTNWLRIEPDTHYCPECKYKIQNDELQDASAEMWKNFTKANQE